MKNYEGDTVDREARIDAMLDKQEIFECLLRYTRGIDRHDVELARSAYHEDGRDDHAHFVGSGYDMIDWVNEAHDQLFRGHQHYIANVQIDLEGDQAHAETYNLVVGQKRDGLGHILGGGRYLDRLERREARWRIVDRIVIVEWADTYEEHADLAFPPTQDRSDPSYDRPLRVTRQERRPGVGDQR